MAFIATYISTTSASELSSYFEEIAEWTSTADVSSHELAIQESYDYVNSFLDPYMTVPISKEQTSGRYPVLVRWAQAKTAIAMCRERKLGSTDERVIAAWKAAAEAINDMVGARAQFEEQTSPDEVGIGAAIPATTNTSSARLVVDRSRDFKGQYNTGVSGLSELSFYNLDHEQTYTVTCSLGGAVGTATFSWTDGEGNTHTGVTSSYDWTGLEKGVRIRCIAGTFVINNTWTIRCVPEGDRITTAAGGIQNLELRK